MAQTHTQTAIIQSIREWTEEQGEPPKVAHWRVVGDSGWPSYLTVIRAFGSWDKAIEAAGFEPRGRGRKFRG